MERKHPRPENRNKRIRTYNFHLEIRTPPRPLSMPFVLSAVGGYPICAIGDELYVGPHATSVKGVISAAAVEDEGGFYIGAITLSKSVQVLRSEDKREWNVVAKQYVDNSSLDIRL